MPSGGPRIDLVDTQRPLYVVAIHGVPTDEQFQGYLDWMVEVAGRGPHAMVIDATHSGMVSARQRKMQAQWMEEHEELNRRTTAAMSFVLPNPLLRGLLTAILWLQPMPCPFSVVSTRARGVRYCEARLRERGLIAAESVNG